MSAISRIRKRIGIATVSVLVALPLSLVFVLSTSSLVFAAGEHLLQISSDPFTNPDAQHKTEVEPDNFAFGHTIVAAVQQGRIFSGGADGIGFATSRDGGDTWVHGSLPGLTVNTNPPGPYNRASDASVAFDAKHNVWLISSLGIHATPTSVTSVDVVVNRSTDGGRTWSNAIPVDARGTTQGEFLDKNWTACDDTPSSPFFGNCYTEYDDNTVGDLIQMSTSTDGGLTWGPPQTTADAAHGIGGQPLVQPNGRVVVPIIGLDSPFFAFTISSFVSNNGGASWSAPVLVSEADFHPPSGGIRAGIPLPSAEVDKVGKVYVAWSDCRFEASCASSDIVLSTSTNGTTWSTVRRVPIDPVGSGVDHFIPGLAVDRSTSGNQAHLGLGYYFYPHANCTPSTCQLRVGFVSSTNGGNTWSQATQLTGSMKLSWLPNTSQGRMVGDYISTAIVPGDDDAFPVFEVAHAPTPSTAACGDTGAVCHQATNTISKDLLLIVGGNASSAGDQPVAQVKRVAGAKILPPITW